MARRHRKDADEDFMRVPDYVEQARAAAREALLLTTKVDVPRAGLP